MNGNGCCEVLHTEEEFSHTVPCMRLKNNPDGGDSTTAFHTQGRGLREGEGFVQVIRPVSGKI